MIQGSIMLFGVAGDFFNRYERVGGEKSGKQSISGDLPAK